jgi:hypothetical protein
LHYRLSAPPFDTKILVLKNQVLLVFVRVNHSLIFKSTKLTSMRKSHLLLFSGILFMNFILSCSKDKKDGYAGDPFFNAPAAQASNDNKSGGIYKGTLTGSSGSFYLNLQNGVNKMYAIFDGVKDTLSTSTSISSGSAVNQAIFTGRTGMTLTFSVAADGSNATVNAFAIPGHPYAEAFVFKETSSQEVRVYEGRFDKTGGGASCQSGLLNIVITGTNGNGYYKEDGGLHLVGTFSGPITSNQFTFTAGTTHANCTINSAGTAITGTASDLSGCTSSISCQRTF